MTGKPTITGVVEFGGGEYSRLKLSGKDFADFAWDVYNFVNDYKSGKFGITPLSEAINQKFVKFQQNYLKDVK